MSNEHVSPLMAAILNDYRAIFSRQPLPVLPAREPDTDDLVPGGDDLAEAGIPVSQQGGD